MSLIKDIYSAAFYEKFGAVVETVVPSFNSTAFSCQILTEDFQHMEWKQRMEHTTRIFHIFLPQEFAEAFLVIKKIIDALRINHFGEDSLAFVFFPDYIARYGLDDYPTAVQALEFTTQFVSCEFAVRPFLLKYKEKMITQMIRWSKHENYKVRRFASEGSRPRLPWAITIPFLKVDPSSILPLLENLKNDPSEWVRRSVANNLNDIAKDHPELVINLAKKWKGISKETDAVIKHGCRTLLKQGHAGILKHYGLDSADVQLNNFIILTPEVSIGEHLQFTFSISNLSQQKQVIRLEYAIYYQKANGRFGRKVFKISEKPYPLGAAVVVNRKHSFRTITTRTFYVGEHRLSIILNGEEKGVQIFHLIG